MKRSQILLSALAGILVIALFYILLYSPTREELAEVELAIAAELDQQALLSQEIERLRSVRAEAPEVEAQLAAAEAIVPPDAALPSALRQLQLAADESGIVLQAITTGRPLQVPDLVPGLSSVDVGVQLVGGYFQVVDFLRRVEDPMITPRGLVWNSANVARDEYPDLNVALSGSVYAMIAVPPAPEVVTPIDPEARVDEDGNLIDEDGNVIENGVDAEAEDNQ